MVVGCLNRTFFIVIYIDCHMLTCLYYYSLCLSSFTNMLNINTPLNLQPPWLKYTLGLQPFLTFKGIQFLIIYIILHDVFFLKTFIISLVGLLFYYFYRAIQEGSKKNEQHNEDYPFEIILPSGWKAAACFCPVDKYEICYIDAD